MSTLRDLVSGVRSTHRLLSSDAMITDRAIASEIRESSLLLIKRETNLRKLWATDTIFTTIPCLEMVEVPISECCEYSDNLTIARSKYKLPRIAEGNYNYVIQGVYSIHIIGGQGRKLKEISINRYLNLLKLETKRNEEYFFINNGYLYVTSAAVEKVRISALFEEIVPNNIMYPEDCDCGDVRVDDDEYCMNPLDKEFFLPGYLEAQVMSLVSKSLMESYFRLKGDITSDGLDEQQTNVNPNINRRV